MRNKRHVAFIAALALQLLILAAIPAQKVLARLRGAPITLKTRPIDPYNILSGYYVTLAYDVENGRLEPPPSEELKVWVNVKRDTPAWTLESVTRERPPQRDGLVSI